MRTLVGVLVLVAGCGGGGKKAVGAPAPAREATAPPGLTLCSAEKRGRPAWTDASGKRVDSGVKPGIAFLPPQSQEAAALQHEQAAAVALPEAALGFYRERGVARVQVLLKVCVAAGGQPQSACFVAPPGQADVEQLLLDTVAEWRFAAERFDHCGTLAFDLVVPPAVE